MSKRILLVFIALTLSVFSGEASNFGEDLFSDSRFSVFSSRYGTESEEEDLEPGPSLDFHIGQLKDILKIAKIDPQILSEENTVGEELCFEGVDSRLLGKVFLFYSEVEEEREGAFHKEILSPLLVVFKAAAEVSYDFPQTLKYLGDPNNFFKPLVQVAIKDIFSNSIESIEELLRTIESLNRNGRLIKEEKEGLQIFKKLSGYFYDTQALKYLEKELIGEKGFFKVHKKDTLSFKDPLVKFSLLRILQRIGEFSKSISSLTLSSMLDESALELLCELRDRHLSHITSRKLELILSAEESLFEEVYDELEALGNLFQVTSVGIRTEDDFSSPLEHWEALKSLAPVSPVFPVERRGLEGLRRLLSYSKKSVGVTSGDNGEEIEELLQKIVPFSYTEEEVDRTERISENAEKISKILRNEQIESVEELYRNLQEGLDEGVDLETCRKFFEVYWVLIKEERELFEDLKTEKDENRERIKRYLEKFSEEHRKLISKALNKPRVDKFAQKAREVINSHGVSIEEFEEVLQKSALYEEAARAKLEQKKARKTQIDEEKKDLRHSVKSKLLDVEEEELQAIMKKYEQIKSIKKKRTELKRKLQDSNVVKPSYGYRNFTDEFESFSAFLRGQEVEVEDEYDWLGRDMSDMKKLFHITHHIPIDSFYDQCRHRYRRVQELIKFISLIRQVAAIEEDIALEVEKDNFRRFIGGKSGIMCACIRRVEGLQKGADFIKQLSDIQKRFSSLRDEMKVSLKEVELVRNQETSRELIGEFLKIVQDQDLLSDSENEELRRQLENLARMKKRRQLLHFQKKQSVKSNPRFCEHRKLSEKVEKSVKSFPVRYVGYEFLVGAFYELFKEVNDYPEFSVLRPLDQVRNHFFHSDPFYSEALEVKGMVEAGIRGRRDVFGTISKEVSILTVNVKFLLEQFLLDMIRDDSLDKRSLDMSEESLDVDVQGTVFRLKKVVVPGNGDCGYLAMGTTRSEAADLLKSNASSPGIRELVGEEVYDMFATLPEEINQGADYKSIIENQAALDRGFQALLSSMNDQIGRSEGARWNEDEVFQYCSSGVELSEDLRTSFEELRRLRQQREELEVRKVTFCESEDVFNAYVDFYMMPEVGRYIRKYGESNWLNASSIPGRRSSADAVAELKERNLVIVNQDGEIEHEYTSQGEVTTENTLFLLHVGNWHFDRLTPVT